MTDIRRPKPIKTILAGFSGIVGIIMMLSYITGVGELTSVFGILGIALLGQALFYWWM